MSNAKKKILYVITKSSWGGAQRYVYDLATDLPTDSYDVAVALGGNGPLIDRLSAADIRTIRVANFTRNVSLFRDIRTLFELTSIFRTEAPDVIHLSSAKAVSIGALAGRIAGVPRIIATIHGSAAQETWRPWWQRVVIRMIERISRLLAHVTIVVSKADHTEGTTLIHNGIADIIFKPRTQARSELGLPEQAFIVGTIGELTANKNQSLLIDAVGALTPDNITLAIIGDGELLSELEIRARKYPAHDIRFLGYTERAPQYLRAFDIFVLPSLKEGLPYVLLEAGLAGLPVIATNVGGISEIIEDKKTGLPIASEDFSALSQTLQMLLDNKTACGQYGNALREKVAHDFSLQNMVAKTIACY